MRGILAWMLASLLTFLVVSLAFLILANLATDPPEVRLLPGPSEERPGVVLSLGVDEDALAEITAAGEQEIPLTLTNESDRELESVSLVAEVSSEDTSTDSSELYRQQVEELLPGEEREIIFTVSLPNPQTNLDYPDGTRSVVEFRATPQTGTPAYETVILPVSEQVRSGEDPA